jgi:hypothetical protein
MTLAYVDTSYLAAIAFDEPGARTLATRTDEFDRLVSSNLLDAELRSAMARESSGLDPEPLFASLSWIYPNRPLTRELRRIVTHGYLKGADLWHLACALLVCPAGSPLTFLTLDKRQRDVAASIGFDI